MFMMMAVDKMHGIHVVATVTFLSFALMPVILISAVDAKASSHESDLQQCLPTVREKCQVKRHPNGSMVQTVPKRFHLPPAIAESLKRKMKTETPVQHLMCRFPDCDGNLCKNGWCEETLDGYKCHCSIGFHGEHCDEKSIDKTTAEATSTSMTSSAITTKEHSEITTSQAATTTESIDVTAEATTISTYPDAACGSVSQAFNGSCYIFSTSEVDRGSAVSACSQHRSHLVYIGSQEEQDFIMGNIGDSSKDYWIGLTRVPATWLDGSSLTYDKTQSDSFNDGGECFITHYVSWGYWDDKGCSSEYRYICEKESGAACESNDWQPFGESCYIFSTSEVNHGSAVSACSQHGSHLVYIGSQEEQDFIMDKIGSSWKEYWIGLTRVPATWLDGSSLTYDGTVSMSFNEGGECFIISSYSLSLREWHDRECSNEYRYICKKEIGD